MTNPQSEPTASSEGAGDPSAATVELVDWQIGTPLRCPQCGNRGGPGQAGLWADVSVAIRGDGSPGILLPPGDDDRPLECGRCQSEAPFSAFLPPWETLATRACTCRDLLCAAPLPLTPEDRTVEAAWLTSASNHLKDE